MGRWGPGAVRQMAREAEGRTATAREQRGSQEAPSLDTGTEKKNPGEEKEEEPVPRRGSPHR